MYVAKYTSEGDEHKSVVRLLLHHGADSALKATDNKTILSPVEQKASAVPLF